MDFHPTRYYPVWLNLPLLLAMVCLLWCWRAASRQHHSRHTMAGAHLPAVLVLAATAMHKETQSAKWDETRNKFLERGQ